MFDLRKNANYYIDLTDENVTTLKKDKTYSFIDETTGKKLVAKFMDKSDELNNNQDLIAEFRKMVLLSTEPEIGTVYYLTKAFTDDFEYTCYVMDFIKGASLADYLKNKKLSYKEAIDIIEQIASGLEKAHHYEIFHNDLHSGNIMISGLGYTKIIDFLWRDISTNDQQNLENDLFFFKRLVVEIASNCKKKDQNIIQKFVHICDKTTSFRGLKKKISSLAIIIEDFILLPKKSIEILEILFSHIKEDYHYHLAIGQKDVPIPDKYIPELTEDEKKQKEHHSPNSENSSKLNLIFMDSLKYKILAEVEKQFIYILSPLEQTGLSTWDINVQNGGIPFHGPYTLIFGLNPTSKLIKWKKLNDEINFIPLNSGEDLDLFNSIMS